MDVPMAGKDRRRYKYDFFLSRRGAVAEIAREVSDVLTEHGYRVVVQDYDFRLGDSVIERMHESVRDARDLIVLFSSDYERSPYCRKEFTSFEAQRLSEPGERSIVVLRCDDAPMKGLLADVAYQDLVGIEDRDERKRRIIAAAERQSQSAPPPPRPFIALPPRVPSFTGRDDELDRLDAILIHGKPAVVTQSIGRVALQGMGGVGKTSLAVEYAYRYRELYAGVCWCPAETRADLLAALASLAVTLGLAEAEAADTEKAAKAALQRLAEHRANWLLVYDNVASPNEIVGLLPSAGARVLITSRFSDWTGHADEVALTVLSPDEAVTFLQSRAAREDAAGARLLAEALGYLPLALDHAGAYCKRTQMGFAEYASSAWTLIASAPRDVMYPRSVAVTFDLAIGEAEDRCSAAGQVMAFLGYCAPVRIPIYFLQAFDKRDEAIAVLAELSLVKHEPFDDGVQAVTVHRLVQAIARRRAEAKDIARATMERVEEGLSMAPPPSPQRSGLGILRQLIPQLRPLVHRQHLWRYQLEHWALEFSYLASRCDQAADKLAATGLADKSEKARERATKLREHARRLEAIRRARRQ
ncbi:tetratricopeptide repeat protein [Bradyrhizobium monzae]|uniref:tetratricopeptide repeat protein n=1 Tax=Bradyrhizobium sp. Oc8 TaxID=2876780 RepID=UPI001F3B31F4|nr:toll/interleukin-1 receptor domain-containing protein [Bradyrhizobium sp. Oc8]